MRSDDQENTISSANRQFANRLALTLREQEQQLDDTLVKQLAASRTRALTTRPNHWSRYAMAVAASVLLVLLIPEWMSSEPDIATAVVDDGLYMTVDPDLLATMDMLALFDGEMDVSYVN